MVEFLPEATCGGSTCESKCSDAKLIKKLSNDGKPGLSQGVHRTPQRRFLKPMHDSDWPFPTRVRHSEQTTANGKRRVGRLHPRSWLLPDLMKQNTRVPDHSPTTTIRFPLHFPTKLAAKSLQKAVSSGLNEGSE